MRRMKVDKGLVAFVGSMIVLFGIYGILRFGLLFTDIRSIISAGLVVIGVYMISRIFG